MGKTYGGHNMYGFYITDNTSNIPLYLKKKNVALITGLHHSREPLCLTFILLMVRKLLLGL